MNRVLDMRIWTLGAKVADLDREIRFVEALGGRLLIDDLIPYEGASYRIPLVQLGDKYMHLAQRMVYEDKLATPLANGLCHVVYQVSDLETLRAQALAAGASEVAPVSRVSAGFGVRDVAFLRSPGGVLIELVRILENTVPEV
jgi:catechol 2,3-dioxygenase-like lactoylglutathione lyase family enzyme